MAYSTTNKKYTWKILNLREEVPSQNLDLLALLIEEYEDKGWEFFGYGEGSLWFRKKR